MKKKILLLMLCAFSSLIAYSQNDDLKDTQNQQEPEKEDFCEILNEFCIKTEFESIHGGTTTYHLEEEELSKRGSLDHITLMNLYKDRILTPQDSFHFHPKRKQRKRYLKDSVDVAYSYGFSRYYKGLKVIPNSATITVNKKGTPYLLKTNANLIDLDTTSIISINQAVDKIRLKYNTKELSVIGPIHLPAKEYPSLSDVTKLIISTIEKPNSSGVVVYRILLTEQTNRNSFGLPRHYYVNVQTGDIEWVEDLFRSCNNFNGETDVTAQTQYNNLQQIRVETCNNGVIDEFRMNYSPTNGNYLRVLDSYKLNTALLNNPNDFSSSVPGQDPLLSEFDFIVSWDQNYNLINSPALSNLPNHPSINLGASLQPESTFSSYYGLQSSYNYYDNQFNVTDPFLDKVRLFINASSVIQEGTNPPQVVPINDCNSIFYQVYPFFPINDGYTPSNYSNVYPENGGLNPFIMLSNGSTGCTHPSSIDVIGHEYQHGVTGYHLGYNLKFPPNSGSLNSEAGIIDEALSDIFGVLIKADAENTYTTDWGFASELGSTNANQGYRSISNPHNTPAPNNTTIVNGAPKFYKESGKWLELSQTSELTYIHHNNSVITHWFYLLAEGEQGSMSGTTVDGNPFSYNYNTSPGIGISKAEDILWNTLVANAPTPSQVSPIQSIQSFADKTTEYITQEYNIGNCDCKTVVTLFEAWKAVNIQTPSLPCLVSSPNIYIKDSDDQKLHLNKHGYLVPNPTDRGNEPNIDCDYEIDGTVWHQFIWDSPDIWNCNVDDYNFPCTEPDGVPAYYHADDPQTNILNVRVHNRGADFDPNIHNITLNTYWTVARTGELWPIHWQENVLVGGQSYAGYNPIFEGVDVPEGAILGGEIGSTSLSNTLAQGESQVFEFPWGPPDPEQNVGDYSIHTIQEGEYTGEPQMCLLARIVSSDDPMANESTITDADGGRTSHNVYENNNIATKNVAHLTTPLGKPGPPSVSNGDIKVVMVNNDALTNGNIAIHFAQNYTNQDAPLTSFGDLYIYPDNVLWSKMVDSDFAGEGFTVHNANEQILKMTEGRSSFVMEDLDYGPAESRFVGFRFEENATGKSEIDKPANFNHFLYHTVKYQDQETNETVEREGASGINFRSSFAPSVPKDNDFVTNGFIQINPNPTNGLTRISFNLDKKSKARLVVFDATGKEVAVLNENRELTAGPQNFILDASKFLSGLYFVSLVLEDEIHSQKLVVSQ